MTFWRCGGFEIASDIGFFGLFWVEVVLLRLSCLLGLRGERRIIVSVQGATGSSKCNKLTGLD